MNSKRTSDLVLEDLKPTDLNPKLSVQKQLSSVLDEETAAPVACIPQAKSIPDSSMTTIELIHTVLQKFKILNFIARSQNLGTGWTL
jgi:hypothetical protein